MINTTSNCFIKGENVCEISIPFLSITSKRPLRKPVAGGDRYEVRVTAGDHLVRIDDPGSGAHREIHVRGLKDGEERTVQGACLGEGCPATGEP